MTPREAQSRTTLLQKLLLILFGIVLIVFLEAALRAIGVGGKNTLLLRETGPDGEEYFVSNLALNRRLFFPVTGDASNFPRPQVPYARFAVEKKPGTFRFFVVGASSAAAMPYGANVSFCNFLKELFS